MLTLYDLTSLYSSLPFIPQVRTDIQGDSESAKQRRLVVLKEAARGWGDDDEVQ